MLRIGKEIVTHFGVNTDGHYGEGGGGTLCGPSLLTQLAVPQLAK